MGVWPSEAADSWYWGFFSAYIEEPISPQFGRKWRSIWTKNPPCNPHTKNHHRLENRVLYRRWSMQGTKMYFFCHHLGFGKGDVWLVWSEYVGEVCFYGDTTKITYLSSMHMKNMHDDFQMKMENKTFWSPEWLKTNNLMDGESSRSDLQIVQFPQSNIRSLFKKIKQLSKGRSGKAKMFSGNLLIVTYFLWCWWMFYILINTCFWIINAGLFVYSPTTNSLWFPKIYTFIFICNQTLIHNIAIYNLRNVNSYCLFYFRGK